MPRPEAVPTVQIDNDHWRVTEWRFAPGAATGWHRHGLDYVVVPMTTGQLLLEEPGGVSRHVQLATGVSYCREQGAEHDVINDNETEFVFIEIEDKRVSQ
jgi:quercetin dioxygenase-like cupin family protein